MNPFQQIQTILSLRGVTVDHIHPLTDNDEEEHLSLTLEAPGGGDDYLLTIDWMGSDGDGTGILGMFISYPFQSEDVDTLPEAMRLVLWLNRFALVGHFGFQEETGQVYYRYNLVTGDPMDGYADAIAEAVRMVSFFIQSNGELIARVVSGQASCEQVLSELSQLARQDDDDPGILQ